MKKTLTTILAVVLLLALAVPALAAGEPGDVVKVSGFAFHCGHGENGNGSTTIAGQDKNFGKKTDVTLVRSDWDPTVWVVPHNDWACAVCGTTSWMSFSNKSGVPDGKNIQLHGFGFPEEGGYDTTVQINKFVQIGDETVFGEGFDFDIFPADGPYDVALGTMRSNADGEAAITINPGLAEGTYIVRERLPEGYDPVDDLYFTVNEEGIATFEGGNIIVNKKSPPKEYLVTIISGEDLGEAVTSVGVNGSVNYQNHWSNHFDGDIAAFQDIADLEDKTVSWAWDIADSMEQYGVSGHTWETSIDFTIKGENVTRASLMYAADNAIHVTIVKKDTGEVVYDGMTKATGYIDGKMVVLDGALSGWKEVVSLDLTNLTKGDYTMTVVARNASNSSVDADPTNVDGSKNTYSTDNNPGGVLLAFVVESLEY